MALRMSQMLRSSEDVRSTRPKAKKKDVLPAQKKVREEPVPEELSAAAAPAVVRTDLEIYQCLVKVTEEVSPPPAREPPERKHHYQYFARLHGQVARGRGAAG
ncbi:MAG: hypothetical protein OSB73_03185 [Candidatus Latescibacteria bacterium]|nr:hypothetical protein [Candidatus Latescibacterota bacterium]